MVEALQMYLGNSSRDWSQYLTAAEFAYNNFEQVRTVGVHTLLAEFCAAPGHTSPRATAAALRLPCRSP